MGIDRRRLRDTTLSLTGIRPKLLHGESKVLFTPLPASDRLQSALRTAQESYYVANAQSRDAHVKSREQIKASSSVQKGGDDATAPFPLRFEGIKGCRMTTLNGHTVVDLADTASDKFARLGDDDMVHVNTGPRVGEVEVANQLLERYSWSTSHVVRFADSSSEAQRCAIATACRFTKRNHILVVGGPRLDGRADLPCQTTYIPLNDMAAATQALEGSIADELAAIIINPFHQTPILQQVSEDFFEFVSIRARHLGALLIVDETLSSRLYYRGMSDHHGIKPDILILGDWIGGGLPFGAIVGRRGIMDTTKLDRIASSNALCIAATSQTLKNADEDFITRLNDQGEALRARIEAALQSLGITGQGPDTPPSTPITTRKPSPSLVNNASAMPEMRVTSIGSLLQIRFLGEQASTLQSLFWYSMFEQGFLLGNGGLVRLAVVMDSDVLEELVTAVRLFLQRYQGAI